MAGYTNTEGFLARALNSLLMGEGEEALAAVQAGSLNPNDPEYRGNRNYHRRNLEEFKKNSPGLALGGDLTGALLNATLLGKAVKMAPLGAKMYQTVQQGGSWADAAKLAALEGGIGGAGYGLGETPEITNLSQVAKDVGTTTLAGTGLGGALPAIFATSLLPKVLGGALGAGLFGAGVAEDNKVTNALATTPFGAVTGALMWLLGKGFRPNTNAVQKVADANYTAGTKVPDKPTAGIDLVPESLVSKGNYRQYPEAYEQTVSNLNATRKNIAEDISTKLVGEKTDPMAYSSMVDRKVIDSSDKLRYGGVAQDPLPEGSATRDLALGMDADPLIRRVTAAVPEAINRVGKQNITHTTVKVDPNVVNGSSVGGVLDDTNLREVAMDTQAADNVINAGLTRDAVSTSGTSPNIQSVVGQLQEIRDAMPKSYWSTAQRSHMKDALGRQLSNIAEDPALKPFVGDVFTNHAVQQQQSLLKSSNVLKGTVLGHEEVFLGDLSTNAVTASKTITDQLRETLKREPTHQEYLTYIAANRKPLLAKHNINESTIVDLLTTPHAATTDAKRQMIFGSLDHFMSTTNTQGNTFQNAADTLLQNTAFAEGFKKVMTPDETTIITTLLKGHKQSIDKLRTLEKTLDAQGLRDASTIADEATIAARNAFITKNAGTSMLRFLGHLHPDEFTGVKKALAGIVLENDPKKLAELSKSINKYMNDKQQVTSRSATYAKTFSVPASSAITQNVFPKKPTEEDPKYLEFRSSAKGKSNAEIMNMYNALPEYTKNRVTDLYPAKPVAK